MTNDQIKAATSEALTVVKARMASEGRVYPAPLAFTKCRWCNGSLANAPAWQWWVRVGFCSRGCVQERYNEEG